MAIPGLPGGLIIYQGNPSIYPTRTPLYPKKWEPFLPLFGWEGSPTKQKTGEKQKRVTTCSNRSKNLEAVSWAGKKKKKNLPGVQGEAAPEAHHRSGQHPAPGRPGDAKRGPFPIQLGARPLTFFPVFWLGGLSLQPFVVGRGPLLK